MQNADSPRQPELSPEDAQDLQPPGGPESSPQQEDQTLESSSSQAEIQMQPLLQPLGGPESSSQQEDRRPNIGIPLFSNRENKADGSTSKLFYFVALAAVLL